MFSLKKIILKVQSGTEYSMKMCKLHSNFEDYLYFKNMHH
jgi:hypothetical protein